MTNKILDGNTVHSMPDFDAFGYHIMRLRAPEAGKSQFLQVQVFLSDGEVSEPASMLDDVNWPKVVNPAKVWPEDSTS